MCLLNYFSRVQLFATLWTVTHQAPLSMGFSRQEYWSRLPCPSPGDLPDPGKGTNIKLFELRQLLHWQADSLPTEPPGKPKFEVPEGKSSGKVYQEVKGFNLKEI